MPRPSEPVESKKPRIPDKRSNERMGVVVELYGGGRMAVVCEDGKTYMGIIRGKLKKRMWVRVGDVVLIEPWDFESNTGDKLPKAHIIWRYNRTQVNWLRNHGYISDEFNEQLQNI